VGPDEYSGGVTIDVSLTVSGSGAGSTVIHGGAPVLTIGTFGAETEPTGDAGVRRVRALTATRVRERVEWSDHRSDA
jgi:hypothetical protein